MTENSPESEASNTSAADDLKYTELTLRLPGELPAPELHLLRPVAVSGSKRGSSSSSHSLDLILGQGTKGASAKWLAAGAAVDEQDEEEEEEEEETSSVPKPPPAKAQLVGWPPVRASRKNIVTTAKYVKVAVDGAPFLRKVDLQVYTSYEQLLKALSDMFSCFTIRKYINDGKLMEPVNGSEYVAAYEDKDGDWMMVGDVPWKMFVESCKRLRLMKSSDAIGLAPTTPSR